MSQNLQRKPAPEVLGASWDFENIEAYTPLCTCESCGMSGPAAEIEAIATHLAAQESRIPAHVPLTWSCKVTIATAPSRTTKC